MKHQTATVLFSGGIDSTACIHFLRGHGYDVRGIFINFGQAAAVAESQAVTALKNEMKFPLVTITAAGNSDFGAGELTGRNAFLLFASVLLGGCRDGLLAMGLHSGTPYYDCSPAFVERADILLNESTNGRVSLIAPFVHWSKNDIYSYFTNANLPVSKTYSCEAGNTPCLSCASCLDRLRFQC